MDFSVSESRFRFSGVRFSSLIQSANLTKLKVSGCTTKHFFLGDFNLFDSKKLLKNSGRLRFNYMASSDINYVIHCYVIMFTQCQSSMRQNLVVVGASTRLHSQNLRLPYTKN